jgi:hypothetical protein
VPDTSEDAEPLPELPPLGEGEETLGEGEGDFTELLRSFDGDSGLDDSESEELDAGVELEDEGPATPEEVEGTLDIGEMFQARVEDAEGASDELGPPGETTGDSFDDDAETEFDADDAEGALEPEDLVSEELPGIVQAEGDDQEGALSEQADELFGMGEEDPPRRAELPWMELLPAAAFECRVVRCDRGRALAGGARVVALRDEGEPEIVAADLGAPVTSLLLEPDGSALAATKPGKLFRLLGAGVPPEELTSFRTVHSLDRDLRLTILLGGPTQSSRPAALLHVSAGAGVLLESTDRGTTFRQVDLGGRVLALSTGVPSVCAVETTAGVRLMRSEPSGAFRAVGTVGGDLSIEEDAVIASDGDVIAILEAGSGVRVSADSGVTFRRVSGSSRATAVTAGRLGGRASAFAALFDAASGHTSIIWVDAATADAHIVAELLPDLESEEELDDWARVLSVAWDADEETLWVAGIFGVRRFRRPPSA